MSLYAGINIKSGPPGSAPGSGAGAAPARASPSQSPVDPKNNPQAQASGSSTPSTSTTTGQWSAALRFAPVPRKKAPTAPAPSRPLYASISSSASASTTTSTSSGTGIRSGFIPSSTSTTQPSTSSYAPTASSSSSSVPPKDDLLTSTRPRSQITRPPPMALDDDDVNGFAQTAQGKRAAKKAAYLQSASGAYRASSGGGGVGALKKQKELVLFGDDVPYDPLRPCDYSAYKAYVQDLRRKRRLEREEEERARRRARSYSGSSDYTSSDGEGEERDDRANKKARLFAPPSSYHSVDTAQASTTSTPAPAPAPAPAPEFAMKREETGEEAYLRRLAMSSGANKPPVVAAPSPAPPPPRTAVPPPPPPPPPQVAASSDFIPLFAPPLASLTPQTYTTPSAPTSTSNAYPSQVPKPYSANETIQGRIEPFNVQLSEAQIRAREIAEKLGRLARTANVGMGESGTGTGMEVGTGAIEGAGTSASAPTRDFQPVEGAYDPNVPFAQRMMAKFGWEKGKGLGATESGMTSALSVSKNPIPAKKNAASSSSSSSSTTTATTASNIATHSNRIIDRSKESRKTDLDHQWGEPSRIVLLTNLCTVSELDDDLTNEVAEEAAKFGVVERCLYRIVTNEEGFEELRVFLVMSGLAGGYNGCRTFDGRFFGGKTVRARYYDEEAFKRGEWTL
ncbi:BQ2448_6585 [Microbotryum intermedium]|uniref:BQ2448_6585 protein n=1 Tax=Microbotryum intermedium TaxID=269621 RepID=A0A238FQ71_9BASI|nr:BQ2448_6585 [Microbotryum intermedium]